MNEARELRLRIFIFRVSSRGLWSVLMVSSSIVWLQTQPASNNIDIAAHRTVWYIGIRYNAPIQHGVTMFAVKY